MSGMSLGPPFSAVHYNPARRAPAQSLCRQRAMPLRRVHPGQRPDVLRCPQMSGSRSNSVRTAKITTSEYGWVVSRFQTGAPPLMNSLGQNGRMPAIAEPAERFMPLTGFRFEATGARTHWLALAGEYVLHPDALPVPVNNHRVRLPVHTFSLSRRSRILGETWSASASSVRNWHSTVAPLN